MVWGLTGFGGVLWGYWGKGTRVAALPSEMRGFFDCAFDGETVKRSAQNGFIRTFGDTAHLLANPLICC